MTLGRHYVVFAGRFCDAFIRKGILKSFGVLVPAMTVYLGTNYTTIGLILSLNAALMQLACTVMNPLMKHRGTREVAATAGLISGVCIICTAFTRSVYWTGFFFVIAGFFSAASNLGTAIMLHKHYGSKFGAVNSLGLMGISVGSTLLPLLTAELHRYYGLSGTLLILGGLLLNEFPIGAVLLPPRNRDGLKDPALEQEGGHRDADRRTNIVDARIIQDEETLMMGQEIVISKCKNENEESASAYDCTDCLKVLKDTFDFRIFRDEKHFTIFMIPMLMISALANCSWVLFVTSYAVSVGIDSFQAAYLAAVGATGGMASCALQAIVFYKCPHWSPHVMAMLFFTGAVTLIIQTLHSSLPYLLVCSFVIGVSLYGASTVVDAVVAIIVAPKNFQGAMTFTLSLEGIGTLMAGPFSGLLFDFTGSFRTVFLILGGIAGLAHVLSVLLILTRRYNRRHYNEVTVDEDHP